MDAKLAENGKLDASWLPAVYFDTSVLIDYLLAENFDPNRIKELENAQGYSFASIDYLHDAVETLLKSDARIRKVAQLRKTIEYAESPISAVTTPLAICELVEWWALHAFQDMVVERTGMRAIKRKGVKEVGEILRKLVDKANEDERKMKPGKPYSPKEFPFHDLRSLTQLDLGSLDVHGLLGIGVANISQFSWPSLHNSAYYVPLSLAYVQVGAADIMHVLFAQHLGCTYFATFDTDFRRARDWLEQFGLQLVPSVDDLTRLLRTKNVSDKK